MTKSIVLFQPFSVFILSLAAILVIRVLSFYGEETYIYFHQNTFEIVRKLFGFIYRRQKGKNERILGIFLHNKGEKNKVSIRSQERVYFLGDVLTENEAAWLAQEIQDWLYYR